MSNIFCLAFILISINDVFSQGSYLQLPNAEIKLYYEDVGKGKPIIFITGWTMTSAFFKNQQAHFKDKYRVIAYDPRSQGRSDKTQRGNTYAQHALDLREMILSLDLSEVILVGWSNGCLTSFAYLEEFGNDKISKIVCIDETPKWIGDPSTEWVYGTFDDYRSSVKGFLNDERDPEGIVDWMLKEPVDETDKAWMLAEMKQTPDHATFKLYLDGMIADYTDVLKELDQGFPLLFMLREDWIGQGKVWLDKHVPGAETIPISSHAMFWEKPEEFNGMLERFLERD
ncbi:MAG: alpha/beta hydrolase [Bacteroidota bacterium]